MIQRGEIYLVRLTEITQTNILNALGIPHSFHLFPSISKSLSFPLFQGFSL